MKNTTSTVNPAMTDNIRLNKYEDDKRINTKPIINSYPSYCIDMYKPLYGWICPVCGKGISPYVNECSCHTKNIPTYITSNLTDFISTTDIPKKNEKSLTMNINCARTIDDTIKEKLNNFNSSKMQNVN